ncbi:hypothetical protein [Streptacidiphilus sp. MAP5-3]|uniref:hypothetical protein n=1 Tax=unclassified Streptacidiphilus TaxID=2643834 RepID=UPI003514B3D8
MAAGLLEVHPTGQATSKQIPHGTVSGAKYHKCHCLPCMDAAAEYQRRRNRRQGYGTWQPLIDAAPVRAHIEQLHAEGMAYEHIATAAGLKLPNLNRIRGAIPSRPATQRVRHEIAQRILSVRYTVDALPDTAWVPARGTQRRIQALRALGWPLHELAARCGLNRHSLVAVANQRVVYAATHLAVRLLFEDLHDQDPIRHGVPKWVAMRIRRESRAAKFPPPLAWDDIEEDGAPGPGPWKFGFATPEVGEVSAALLEDVRELADLGIPRDQIAARLGRSWNSITTAFNRAGFSVPTPAGSDDEPHASEEAA